MKKAPVILALLLCAALALSLSACAASNASAAPESSAPAAVEPVSEPAEPEALPAVAVEPVSEPFYWETADFPLEEDCVPDAETAVAVAQAVFDRFRREGLFPGYLPQLVEYQDESGVWVVSFWPDGDEPGACFSIALRRDSAQVLRMWVGE